MGRGTCPTQPAGGHRVPNSARRRLASRTRPEPAPDAGARSQDALRARRSEHRAADLVGDTVRDDVPLQGGVDDNAYSHKYLEQAEALWAAAVGADHSRFLVGGSSQGNIAALATVGDQEAGATLALMNLALAELREGRPARTAKVPAGEEKGWRMLQLLTSKPALYVCNVDEGSAAAGNDFSGKVAERAARDNAKAVVISAQIESEIALLDAGERAEFLETLGLHEPGLNRLIREAYALLGLQTYFTAGPKEARAWTIPVGATAPQAAGVIHTDFEKGFIRAETIAFEDYVKHRGEAGAREAGRLRSEGKEYVVHDGDVMNFRFNV